MSDDSRSFNGNFNRGLSKLHSTFAGKIFDFFLKYLQCHNVLGLWTKNFPLFSKKVSRRVVEPAVTSPTETYGEKKFLLIKISTFYDWSDFRMKTFEHSTKKWVELPELQFICPAEVFEKKNFLKRIILSLVSDFQREILDLLAKNVLVCVLVCVWGWGLPILHSTCLKKLFEKILFLKSLYFRIFSRFWTGVFRFFCMKFRRVCLNRPEEEFGNQDFSEKVSIF